MKLNFPDILTIEERAEFTAVNLVAHNVIRDQSEKKQPYWLCMSDEAKDMARGEAAKWFNYHKMPVIPIQVDNEYNLSLFEKILKPAAQPMMQQWVNAEAEYKRLRVEENDPTAFFAD